MSIEFETGVFKHPRSRKLFQSFQKLTYDILQHGHLGKPGVMFISELSRILVEFIRCDVIELRFREGQSCIRCGVALASPGTVNHQVYMCFRDKSRERCENDAANMGVICRSQSINIIGDQGSRITPQGGLWIRHPNNAVTVHSGYPDQQVSQSIQLCRDFRSALVIPLRTTTTYAGLLILKSKDENFFTEDNLEFFEAVAETIGIARAHQKAQEALRERVKELMCLYGIAKLVEKPNISLEEILQGIVDLLAPGWQYPEITYGRIILDGVIYSNAGFQDNWSMQSADIIANGKKRGRVEVAYSKQMPELDEGPFLREERNLINAIAIQVAQIIERRKAEAERLKLQDQLRHADRLATIGQLAAGVAHEFNEPLGNILGFAQLILKDENISGETSDDVKKIITASLHAREVVKKLMLFARQLPADMVRTNLNTIVGEGLYFLEARCVRAGIEMHRDLAPELPDMIANPAQLNQVLVNLVVNAIQAMPDGGTLTISTKQDGHNVVLSVEDTGIGMTEEVRKQIFIPFFTTKDIDEGTGLGLPVIHGIVTAHKGGIDVQTRVDEGSRFDISLPIDDNEDMVEDDG